MIVHEPAKEWQPSQDNAVYQDIELARLKQQMEVPVDERIEYATWPETVAYFSTLTMDGRYANRDVREMYQHSFREYIDRWTDKDLSSQPPPLDEDPDLTEFQKNRLDDLRFGIKKDRDKYFVEEMYDDLDVESVPKSFWLSDYEQSRDQPVEDEFAQSALQDYAAGED